MDGLMNWEDYKTFKEEMLRRGFPAWRFDDINRDIRYSDDVFLIGRIEDVIPRDTKEKITKEELVEFVVGWVEETFEPEFDEEGEPFWYDETYDEWIRIFEYDVLLNAYVDFEVRNELGLID